MPAPIDRQQTDISIAFQSVSHTSTEFITNRRVTGEFTCRKTPLRSRDGQHPNDISFEPQLNIEQNEKGPVAGVKGRLRLETVGFKFHVEFKLVF